MKKHRILIPVVTVLLAMLIITLALPISASAQDNCPEEPVCYPEPVSWGTSGSFAAWGLLSAYGLNYQLNLLGLFPALQMVFGVTEVTEIGGLTWVDSLSIGFHRGLV